MYTPTQRLFIEMADGAFFEGNSYAELVERMVASSQNLSYAEAGEETRFFIRAELADGWKLVAEVFQVPLSADIDPTTDETLIISAAQAGVLSLYENNA